MTLSADRDMEKDQFDRKFYEKLVTAVCTGENSANYLLRVRRTTGKPGSSMLASAHEHSLADIFLEFGKALVDDHAFDART
jgi:hypothetical protein